MHHDPCGTRRFFAVDLSPPIYYLFGMMIRDRWFWAAVGYAICIAIGSSIPGPEMPKAVELVWDKLLHGTEYSVLGFLLARAFLPETRLSQMLLIFLIGSAYGALDEFMQYFTPGRFSSGWDALADSCGVLIGISVYVLLRGRRRSAA